jgi:hypothetical protein
MSNGPDPQSERQFEQSGGGLYVVMLVIYAWSASIEVLLHRRFGERYLAVRGPAVIPLVLVYGACWEGRDIVPLLCFLAAYLVMCARARVDTLARRKRGELGHSMYSGVPRLMKPFPRWRESVVKRFAEPLLVLAAGCVTCAIDEPLGLYLILGSFCVFATATAGAGWDRNRVLDLNDAVIEQQWRAEQFRAVRGDRF